MKKILRDSRRYLPYACLLLCSVVLVVLFQIHQSSYGKHRAVHSSSACAQSNGKLCVDDSLQDRQAASTEQAAAEIKELKIKAVANRENELVFTCSIADFVSSYDGFYWRDHHALYFPASARWMSYSCESAPHFNGKTDYYYYQKNADQLSEPIISVYTPPNETRIQEITLDYDDHGDTEQNDAEYKEMCFYAIKVMLPELKDSDIANLFETMDTLACEGLCNVPYGAGVKPTVLFLKGDIGLYPYFAIGQSRHICMMPVTQPMIAKLISQGVDVREIDAA
ncbi:MAG: hypothetical protein RRZ93_03470 [Ruthenibacterium sp.]